MVENTETLELLEREILPVVQEGTENSRIAVEKLDALQSLLTPEKGSEGPSMTDILNKLLEFIQMIMQTGVELREEQLQQRAMLVKLCEVSGITPSQNNTKEEPDVEFSQDRS